MKRMLFVVLALSATVACNRLNNPVTASDLAQAAFTTSGSGVGDIKPLSLVQGAWAGTETATVGESGPISVVFTQTPAADLAVTATISGLGYSGTLTGTLDNMTITVSDYRCGYVAHGTLNAAGTQISGTYTGSGPGVCATKAGMFVLNGQSAAPPCVIKPADKPAEPGGGNDHDPQPCHGNDPSQGNDHH